VIVSVEPGETLSWPEFMDAAATLETAVARAEMELSPEPFCETPSAHAGHSRVAVGHSRPHPGQIQFSISI
jgi:hypothetical protein